MRARIAVRRALIALPVMYVGALRAQDSRHVMAPVVPPTCSVIESQLALVGDSTIAEGDEARLDSPRIQLAIDACPAGRAVELRASGGKRAFVSGPLRLKTGVTLLVAKDAILFASRDPRQFDVTPNACGRLTTAGRGCRPLISAERADHSGLMGPGTIDGRGWARTLADTVTWWEMAEQARDTKYSQNNPRLLVTSRSNDFTLANITLRNSPNFHVVFERGDGITAWNVTINTPKGARNTDGIDPSGSRNVTITNSHIHTGDDNVAIKAGSNGGAHNMTVSNSHFYSGHGVSIGSETDGGASAILVQNVTFEGTDNALRIKSNGSRGGLVEGVTYENVCVRDVKYPIYMDSHYSASAELDGDKIPEFRNIVVRNVRIAGPGTVMLDGYDNARRVQIAFDRVVADTPESVKVQGGRTAVTRSAGGTNLRIPDSVATVSGPAVAPTLTAELSACPTRLIPFPGGAAKAISVRKLAKPPAPPAASKPSAPVAFR